MNTELTILIQQGFARTRRQGFIVASITLGLAAFMTSLYWLDPEIATYGFIMKLLYAGVTLAFFGVGALMIYTTLQKTPQLQKALLHALQNAPNTIQKAYHYRVVSKAANTGAANPVGSQHYVRIEFTDSKMLQLSFPYNQIATVLEQIYRVAPHTRQQ